MLGLPSGTVPCGLVNSDETTGYHDSINDEFTYEAKRTMEGSAGMPIAVQIAGWNDETVMRVMRELEGKGKFKLPYARFN